MATYVIINGTAAELTNVNAALEDVPAYSVSAGNVLTDAELAAVLLNTGVACIKSTNSAAEKAKIDRVLREGGYSDTLSPNYDVANGTAAVVSNVNLDLDDLPAYSLTLDVPLDAVELQTLLETDGVMVMNDSTADDVKRTAVKVLRLGKFPSVATS